MGGPHRADALAAAYRERDLTALAPLLHGDVLWGDPEDPSHPAVCHGREAVLARFERLRDLGVEASVVEVLEAQDAAALGLAIRWPPAMPERAAAVRYQIFRFAGAHVVEISGTDDRATALWLLGQPSEETEG
ncbi:MAG: nuclear transport factor 2 family protein [Clostridia bacterium]